MLGDPTKKALAMIIKSDSEIDGGPFFFAIEKLDYLRKETDPEETQLVEWMIDRFHEMLFKRVEQSQNADA